jgi:hypothetical protein
MVLLWLLLRGSLATILLIADYEPVEILYSNVSLGRLYDCSAASDGRTTVPKNDPTTPPRIRQKTAVGISPKGRAPRAVEPVRRARSRSRTTPPVRFGYIVLPVQRHPPSRSSTVIGSSHVWFVRYPRPAPSGTTRCQNDVSEYGRYLQQRRRKQITTIEPPNALFGGRW